MNLIKRLENNCYRVIFVQDLIIIFDLNKNKYVVFSIEKNHIDESLILRDHTQFCCTIIELLKLFYH